MNLETTRRTFLQTLGASAALAASPRLLHALPGAGTGSINISPDELWAEVPKDFTGLSYEAAQLTHPEFFSAGNLGLVSMCRTLGAHGVLRIGGNTSAYTRWSSTNVPQMAGEVGPDKGGNGMVPGMYVITPTAIHNLDEFLKATGWGLIYGLNLRHGTPKEAAEEAEYVAKTCGNRLLALQLGNEPDLFRKDENGPRDRENEWTYDEYLDAWRSMYEAVHKKVGRVTIAGPDVASNKEWVRRFSTDAGQQVGLITSHYYAEGPPADPRMTIDFLLHPDERIQNLVYAPMELARTAKLPYRMAEGNSCYNGGKPGVSDTFASSLWAADFMLDLASHGAVGVNFHGGGTGAYTPIAGSPASGFLARPEFYGMLLGGAFAGTKMVQCSLDAGGANAKAYAAKLHDKGLQIAVINKSETDLELGFQGIGSGAGAGRKWELKAPGLESKQGITFGGSEVTGNGGWTMGPGEALGTSLLHVPAYSAVLVRFA